MLNVGPREQRALNRGEWGWQAARLGPSHCHHPLKAQGPVCKLVFTVKWPQALGSDELTCIFSCCTSDAWFHNHQGCCQDLMSQCGTFGQCPHTVSTTPEGSL